MVWCGFGSRLQQLSCVENRRTGHIPSSHTNLILLAALFVKRLLRPYYLCQNSCFISELCFGLRMLVYTVLGVVVPCGGCGKGLQLRPVELSSDSGVRCEFTELVYQAGV